MDYTKKQVKEYEMVTGEKYNPKSKESLDSFKSYLLKRHSIGKIYTDFLKYLRIPFQDISSAEIGKGEADSIVIPFYTTIISKYAYTFRNVDPSRLINADFSVKSGSILLRTNGNSLLVPKSFLKNYMTQNIVEEGELQGWDSICNSGVANITVGAYGSIYDKDYALKLEILKQLKENIYNAKVKEDFATLNDYYFHVITTNNSVTNSVSKVLDEEISEIPYKNQNIRL